MEDKRILIPHSKVYALIDDMTLFDDNLLGAVLNRNIPATELVLRIILKRKDIKVTKVVGQSE